MTGKTVEEVLRSFGLTEKEAEIYIFLAKHGIQKGGEIAKKTRIAKAVVYRTLKILQRKGFIESTFESPSRYSAITFEAILDLNIRTKHEEALQIESSKNDLLSDWKKISKGSPELPVEKFTVIEGTPKIFAKYYQMIKQTKTQLYAVSSVSELLRADHFGVFSAVKNHSSKSKVEFQFVTDLANLDLKTIRQLKRRLRVLPNLRGRNPDWVPRLFPQLVIRDKEEILLFISNSEPKSDPKIQSCLSTNCKSIIQSFSSVFEELWQNSTDLKQKINLIETGRSLLKTQVIEDSVLSKNQYLQALDSAKTEILIVTSSRGLNALSRKEKQLEEWRKKGISTRIMSPIVNSNLNATKKLLKWAEVRHIPTGYFETTIIDRSHLFQFESTAGTNEKEEEQAFHNMFYTNDQEHISKTTRLLYNIWKRTRTATLNNLRSIIEPNSATNKSLTRSVHPSLDNTRLIINKKYHPKGELTRKNVVDKIIREKEIPKNENVNWFDAIKLFGSRAFGIIHPPKYFGIPDIVIGALKSDEESSFGATNAILVLAYLKTMSGFSYVPVAVALDNTNPNIVSNNRANLVGTPAENNIMVFGKNEIQIRVKGKTLFAGWTRPIPLGSLNETLPPSCILFEGYGKCKPGMFSSRFPSGRRHEVWYLTYDAFLTFYHPQEKYVGTGTDAFFDPYAFQFLHPIDTSKKA